MQIDQGKHETLQILHEVKEYSQTFWVLVLLHLSVWAYLRCRQCHLFLTNPNYQLLLAYLVWFGPLCILAVENSAINDDALHLINHCLGNIRYADKIFTLFPDELIAFVLRIIVVLELAIWIQLEIEKLMTVSTSMPDAGWDYWY